MICFIHCCVLSIQISKGAISSFACYLRTHPDGQRMLVPTWVWPNSGRPWTGLGEQGGKTKRKTLAGGSGLKVWGSHHCPCHPAQAEQIATEGKEGKLENAYGMFNTVITLETTTITAKLIWHLLYTRPCAKGETSEEGLGHLPRDTQPPGRDLHADPRPP